MLRNQSGIFRVCTCKIITGEKKHMPHVRIEPWLSLHEYHEFKKLAPDDPALPDTYEEWLEKANEMIQVFIMCGVPVERTPIYAEEFFHYCEACGLNPDGVARASFAVFKARGICESTQFQLPRKLA